MAFWGLLTYVILAVAIWRAKRKPGSWTMVLFVAVCGFAISAYLTVVSVVEIEATCPYCLASFVMITAIMILTLVRQPPNWSTSLKEALVIAVLLVGGLHLHYSGMFDVAAGPEDPQLQALAIHLAETGVKFYGAYWCPRCQAQKDVFEASAKRLPYVECSSGGRGSALTKACAAEKIRSYPTWIIGERRLTGLQTPRALASASDFEWKE
jgi:thiol-disulfide isomerase/thioredoxin